MRAPGDGGCQTTTSWRTRVALGDRAAVARPTSASSARGRRRASAARAASARARARARRRQGSGRAPSVSCLDAPQPRQVGVGVEPACRPACGAARSGPAPRTGAASAGACRASSAAMRDQVLGGLVHAQAPLLVEQLPRGSSRVERGELLERLFCCSAAACAGTSMRTRAIRSPRLPPVEPLARPGPPTRSERAVAGAGGHASASRARRRASGPRPAAPSAASAKVTGTSMTRSSPRRVKRRLGRPVTCTNRSPAGPPRVPASPLPRRRMRGAVLDAGGDRAPCSAGCAGGAAPAAGRARVVDDVAVAAAARARLREREEALVCGRARRGPCIGAGVGRVPAAAPRAAAVGAGDQRLDRRSSTCAPLSAVAERDG